VDAVPFDADTFRLAIMIASGLLQDCFRKSRFSKGNLDTGNLVGGLQGSL
jgi:hypothetical protein